ncbi:hypothetical protein ACFQS1_05515 [Paractinoplanes rhizophilus]|uniref:RelA/SpoT domain-containing protein n=1 Tax=Paractinoplanes rhizophilus TaxID=1416877 RepID=A0ABW2HJK3_9ACTN
MALPISKQQFNRLGERIAAGDPPAREDLTQLNQVLRAYQAILDTVEEQLAGIGLHATTRVKTRSVLIEKLRREHGMLLARVQDLAGARTVIDGGWTEQDGVVSNIVTHFHAWTGKAPKVVDRRVAPSHGYRAVHVIVFPDGVPVEIQVRTELQNYWAQIVERLADRWGRNIRYGADPENPQLPAEGIHHRDGSPVTRGEVIRNLRAVSLEIAAIEATERQMNVFQNRTPASLEQRIANTFHREMTDPDADAVLYYPRLRRIFKDFITRGTESRALRLSLRRRMQSARRVAGRIIRRTVPNIQAPNADFVRRKILLCDKVVDSAADEFGSRLKQQQASLRDTLQTLTEYVDQGGIR